MPRMHRLAAHLLIALLPLLPAGQALAAPTPAEAPDVVRVSGLRATPWKSYRALRAAMAAYEQHKDLAPDAVFTFSVKLPGGQPVPPTFAMRVLTPDGKEYPVAMDGQSFMPPILPDDALDGDLVTNLKGIRIKIGIRVETPGVPVGMNRLGDLRLVCRIDHAIADVEDNVLRRLIRPNVCENPIGGWWFGPASVPTDGGMLVEGTRSAQLERHDRQATARYRIPLHDTSWSNEALVQYQYRASPDWNPQFYFRDRD